MRQQPPNTRALNVSDSDVHRKPGELPNQILQRETLVLVMKSAIPVAEIVSVEDLERIERLDQERAERFRVIDEMRSTFHDLSPEEIEREAACSLAAVRTEREQTAASQ